MSNKPWLQHYAEGVPAEIDLDSNMTACIEIATRAMLRLAAS